MEKAELEEYLNNGIKNILKGIAKAAVKNPKASFFMMQHAVYSKTAKNRRKSEGLSGNHIPAFLIASITNLCNLHCKGCYARANNSCTDNGSQKGIMTDENWNEIFFQAEELGIEFILLIGGEPFVRRDVIKAAGNHKNIIFPVFTNGTMIDEDYIKLLDKSRNIWPVLSIEGNRNTTDERRGYGVYNKLKNTMKELQKRDILFGSSVTVTKKNMNEVLSDEFINTLKDSGSKTIIYVEYVPTTEKSKSLALNDEDRIIMMNKLDEIRKSTDEMMFIAFPGDEKRSGGCLAAGRGFFHINAYGGAEPCPFSPFTDTNILKTSLKEALGSPLFQRLKENGNLEEEHIGGCTLFAQKEKVAELLKG